MSWKTLFLHLKCLVVCQRIKEEHFNTNCISQEPAYSVTVHRRTHTKFLQVKIHRSISLPPSTTSIHESMRIIVHDVSHIFSNVITTVPICMHLFSPIILLLSILRLSFVFILLHTSIDRSVWVSVHMIFRILPRPLDLWVQYLHAQCPPNMIHAWPCPCALRSVHCTCPSVHLRCPMLVRDNLP